MYGNYFTFEELTQTNQNLANNPLTDEHLANLAALWNTLNLLRHEFGRPIYINSCYRTPAVNKQVGGSKRSLHLQGRAADIRTRPEYMEALRKFIDERKDEFSQVIHYETFIHISQ